MHKRFVLMMLIIMISSLSFAQMTEKFNYQAVVRNANGELVMNSTIAVQISVLQTSSSGTAVFQETFSPTTSDLGLINLVIGSGTNVTGDLGSIDWSSDNYFLKLEIDLNGATEYTEIGTSQLLSVPYALYAKSSGEAQSGGNWDKEGDNVYFNSGNVGIGSSSPVSKLEVKADPAAGADDPLFEVINAADDTVFAVYPDGVKVFVNSSGKGKVGGFAVSGRTPGKAPGDDENYLYITPDSARITYNKSSKGKVGGFAVSGRTPGKGVSNSLINLFEDNYFIGHQSGENNTTGTGNLFLGYESGLWNNTGRENIFIGPNAGHQNSRGFGNIFIGQSAGHDNTNIDSTAGTGTEGYFNVYIGYHSGEGLTRGKYNTYLGYYTGGSAQTGQFNTFIGNQAGNQNGGTYNTLLGVKAGEVNWVGERNVMVGSLSGYLSKGSDNVFIGYASGYSENGDNKLYISNQTSTIVSGDFSTRKVNISNTLNLTSVSSFPSSPDVGDIVRIDASGSPTDGIYVYNGSGWSTIVTW